MWNPREQHLHQHHHVEEQDQEQDEDDSWEVRAFAEDTNNIMGTTWPPRSYSCTFCRREFRSAQALGGHMNVHRRDRARLHHRHHHQLASPHNHNISSFSNHTPSFLNISHHEPNFVANGGLCLLYPFQNPNNNNAPLTPLSSLPHNNNACGDSPSTVFSVSSFSSHDSLQCPPIMVPPSCSATSFDYFSAPAERNNNVFSSSSGEVLEQEPAATTSSSTHEELDLELRLGNRSTSSS